MPSNPKPDCPVAIVRKNWSAQIAPTPKKTSAKVPTNSATSFWGLEYIQSSLSVDRRSAGSHPFFSEVADSMRSEYAQSKNQTVKLNRGLSCKARRACMQAESKTKSRQEAHEVSAWLNAF